MWQCSDAGCSQGSRPSAVEVAASMAVCDKDAHRGPPAPLVRGQLDKSNRRGLNLLPPFALRHNARQSCLVGGKAGVN
jgi:hypothetical protein